jgi:hypothetical protein
MHLIGKGCSRRTLIELLAIHSICSSIKLIPRFNLGPSKREREKSKSSASNPQIAYSKKANSDAANLGDASSLLVFLFIYLFAIKVTLLVGRYQYKWRM